LFENYPVETITVDYEARVTGYNLARQKVNGRLPDIGDVMYKDYAANHSIDMHRELIDCIKRGVSKEFPGQKYKDRYLYLNMAPFDGGAIITSRDITFQTLADKAVRKNEERYRTIFECAGTAMMSGDEDTTILVVNSEFEKLSGYSKKEIEGKRSWQEFIAKDDLEKIKEYHHLRRTNAAAAPRTHEFRFVDRNGSIKHVFATVGIIPGTKIGVSSFLDITHRKQAEEEREKLIVDLREALSTVKQLSGLLPICSSCKKIRDDKGYWNQIEVYIRDRSEADFSHGICPECARELYPELLNED
jgi:PAS domain S-box-containing protein